MAACEGAGAGAPQGSVRLSFIMGLYHECSERVARLGAAHLVFGPNAGACWLVVPVRGCVCMLQRSRGNESDYTFVNKPSFVSHCVCQVFPDALLDKALASRASTGLAAYNLLLCPVLPEYLSSFVSHADRHLGKPYPLLDLRVWAGLAAYPSWVPTLQLLARPDAPPAAYFTDFCEEAALRATQVAAACLCAADPNPDPGEASGEGEIGAAPSAGGARMAPEPGHDAAGAAQGPGSWRGGTDFGQALRDGDASRVRRVGAVHVNPFRQPLSCQGADNALPSYSNAFGFFVS